MPLGQEDVWREFEMHIGPLGLPEIILILLVCAVILGTPILIVYIIIKMVKHVK